MESTNFQKLKDEISNSKTYTEECSSKLEKVKSEKPPISDYVLLIVYIPLLLLLGSWIIMTDEEMISGSYQLPIGLGVILFSFVLVFFYVRGFIKRKKVRSRLKDEIKLSKQRLEQLELDWKRELSDTIQKFKSSLDSDGDNTIDVIQHNNEFLKILKSNQEQILEMEKSENRDFTKQFVKLSNFLIEKEKNLQRVFQRIDEIDDLQSFEYLEENLIQQIQFYNVLRLNSLQMISSFVEDDRVTFYIIYEKFDRLSVWNTHFQNLSLLKLDVINSNINKLISEIRGMKSSITNSINELISITDEMNDSLNNQLESIGSKLDTGNMLNTINTYQNYKTNNRLR